MSAPRIGRTLNQSRLYSHSSHLTPGGNKFHFLLNLHPADKNINPKKNENLAFLVLNSRHCSNSFPRPTHPSKMAESTTSMNEPNPSSVDPGITEIIVIRHGETEWNADGRIQGHLDVELNELGKEQASLVADRLAKEFKIAAVYSSDLKRALVTAETIASRCGSLQVVKDPELRERHLGDLQGLRLRDASEVSPKAYEAFMSHRSDKDIPGGGESLDQLFDRCVSSLERIAEKHRGERVVVVTHGGVIRQLCLRACPNGKPKGKVLNTSVNIFCISDEDKWTLKTWGDVSHLNQTGFLQSGFGGDATSG